ncbi:hypothetical protein PCC7418_0486 [Halothece sp. PCC 7418]|nr:hypothetical protein [Halothece sp. PCC 7418]AFZ42715.1 hypothetical protein PCC7418_0486 [Halothece sp. PCC 7418]
MTDKKQFIPSEKYRQMLVRDGERRFQEWHHNYINYRKQYLKEISEKK